MITGDIAKPILFDPISSGADKLLILSSYSTPNMSSWYMKQLQERSSHINRTQSGRTGDNSAFQIFVQIVND